MILWWRNYY